MPGSIDKDIEGTTLSVYLYVVKKKEPVGPRDVMKGVHLSSPSVAYRHLEKLEDLKLLQKNNYGEYVAIAKAHVRGFVWIGKHILPKMFVYSLVFLSILVVELLVLAVHYAVENFSFVVFFVLLTVITGSAALVFAIEGLLQRKRTTRQMGAE